MPSDLPTDHELPRGVPPRSAGALRAQLDATLVSRLSRPAQRFVHTEAIGAVVLLCATVAALGWANSPWDEAYHNLLHYELTVDLHWLRVSESIEHWVNDGLMAVFFFVVGMEIKRELAHGELSAPRKAALPVLAALGGMIAPALIYFAFNSSGEVASGWGIPMATDIAFALGALALLGKRLPSDLRIFLLALAVADDLGAILVIAIFYTSELSLTHLFASFGLIALMPIMNRLGVRQVAFYAIVGALAWVAMLKSGVHATIAGVLIGLVTPTVAKFDHQTYEVRSAELLGRYREAIQAGRHERADLILGEIEELTRETEAPLERLEREIHPWSSFLILPVFALANAGIALSTTALSAALSSTVTLGVFMGLVLGKALGITLFSYLAVRIGIAVLPRGVTWAHIAGVGLLGGIGFTVAIFISGLAFTDEALVNDAKLGIFAASLIAGLAGLLALRFVSRHAHPAADAPSR